MKPVPNRHALAVWRSSLGLLLAACASTPLSAPDAEQRLAAAEAHVQAQGYDAALDALADLDGDRCPKRLRDRRDVARANAHVGRGELWEAYLVIEPFPDLYPHSDLRPAVVEMEWQIGNALSKSDRGFLFFWSDQRAARTVLEHLITRHPDTQRLADALKILGDMALADETYELAQQRFRDLMLNRPDSEWVRYAQYRFAMSIVASLEGPEYDLDRMQHAVRELRGFLASKPENPTIVDEAKRAEQRLLAWQVARHRRIAGFYRRIGNEEGEMHHLELAASDEFAGSEGYEDAVTARNELRANRAGKAKP